MWGRAHVHCGDVSCYRRRPFLGTTKLRARFVKMLDGGRSRHKFRVIGYVVMPEHVHLLLSEPARGNPSKVLQVLKQKVSRALHRKTKKTVSEQLLLEFAQSDTKDEPFWQRRFYDFNVWNPKKVKEKLEYIDSNPVKRMLVEHPKYWRWSTGERYPTGEAGMLRV